MNGIFYQLLRLMRSPVPIGMMLLALLWAAGGGTATGADSQIMPLAAKSLLLDGQVVGDSIVVVGERGHILISRDQGASWQQQQVPTRNTLTSIFFVDRETGWAAGHEGVVLKTGDGGKHWQLVHSDPQEDQAILDLWFRDREHGYAVGGYGLFWETTDGGASWQPRDFAPTPLASREPQAGDNLASDTAATPGGLDYHLNQLVGGADGQLFVAAEAGNLYRSEDGGQSWFGLPSPYEGSFYGTLPLSRNVILAFGLRGHLFRSEDAGLTWTAIKTGTQATLNDGILLADGRIALAGLAGTLLLSEDGGRTFQLYPQEDRDGISKILQAGDGDLILIGEQGARRLALPARGKGAAQ